MTGKETGSPRFPSEIVEQIRDSIQRVGPIRKEPQIRADSNGKKP